MKRTDLAELIHNGENSGVELKRDDVAADRLAKEMSALLNLEGGHILLGVEKDRSVTGLTRNPERASTRRRPRRRRAATSATCLPDRQATAPSAGSPSPSGTWRRS
jgi:predicted HTH transcriptional regulator